MESLFLKSRSNSFSNLCFKSEIKEIINFGFACYFFLNPFKFMFYIIKITFKDILMLLSYEK